MIALAALALAAQSGATPLLDYARTLSFDTAPRESEYRLELVRAEQELAAHPPPADCAHTLGASRFAGLLQKVAYQRAWLADHAGAADAYRRALACLPRARYLYGELAEELMNAGHYPEARTAAARGLTLAPEDFALGSVMARLDFIDERWSDAINWLRAAAAAAPDAERKAYMQCLLWLAEQRSGVAHPPVMAPTGGDDWPGPILSVLEGTSSEADLLGAVKAQTGDLKVRETLVEALFYVGEQRLAQGDATTARRYFAAAVNLKVIYYIEHDLALAELAKLRAARTPSP